ncbi:MAG: hypothetical protein ACE5G2_02920 [Candidatus Krumholzibacteriia bacterium]
MGVFFKSEGLVATVRTALQDALSADPASISNLPQTAADMADEVKRQLRGQIAWVRLGLAVAILLGIFVAAVYTGRDPDLQGLHEVLLHALELFLGGLVGLIFGEAAGRE